MIKFEDKLPITEQDLEYFKTEWLSRVDSKEEKERYRFYLDNDIIKVQFVTITRTDNGTNANIKTMYYIKIKHPWNNYESYHCYDPKRNLVFDSELFFMENCKNAQRILKGGN